MTTPDAPRNTKQAAAFMRAQHDSNTTAYKRACLILQRKGRGIPPVYPTARSASLATPMSERVYSIADFRRGMVGYSHGTDPAGHIFYIAGWKDGSYKKGPSNADKLLVWSNDVRDGKKVGLVPITFFQINWHHQIDFAGTWLNGYNFAQFDKPAEPDQHRAKLGDNFAHGIEDLEKALRYHKKHGNKELVALLERDLATMKDQLAKHK